MSAEDNDQESNESEGKKNPLQEWRLKNLKDSDELDKCPVCGKQISDKGICSCNDIFTED